MATASARSVRVDSQRFHLLFNSPSEGRTKTHKDTDNFFVTVYGAP
jgi:hypothetical protein